MENSPNNSNKSMKKPKKQGAGPSRRRPAYRRMDAATLRSILDNLVSDSGDDDHGAIPNELKPYDMIAQGHSVEMCLGRMASFAKLLEAIETSEVRRPIKDFKPGESIGKLSIKTIKKICLMIQDVTSFDGLNAFESVREAYITGNIITNPDLTEFTGDEPLEKLYIHNNKINILYLPSFKNLTILSIATNRFNSLEFLRHGLPGLKQLNAAKNCITSILEHHVIKCVNLQIINLSGNPLSRMEDIHGLRCLKNLKTLELGNALFGECPIIKLNEGRAMVISTLPNITKLDGKKITSKEENRIESYINKRSLHYYTNSVKAISQQLKQRKEYLGTVMGKLENIGSHLLQLLSLAAQYRRVLFSISTERSHRKVQKYFKYLMNHLEKIEEREIKLRHCSSRFLKRIDTQLQISQWEQEVEIWTRWIEFQSFGTIQCSTIYSVHGPVIHNSDDLLANIHQLISALSCANLWPSNKLVKVESVIVIKDKGLEAGMERVYFQQVGKKLEPPYVCPGPEFDNFMKWGRRRAKRPKTFTTREGRLPTKMAHNFPDSICGLIDRSQPVFMFLVCPPDTTSLIYLQQIMSKNSEMYTDIKVTNCFWSAVPKLNEDGCVTIVVVKVLSEFLLAIQQDKRGCSHSWDCTIFSMKRALTFTPAYILNISFTSKHKDISQKISEKDESVIKRANDAMSKILKKISKYKFQNPPTQKSPYLNTSTEGIEANLNALQMNVTEAGILEVADHMNVLEKKYQSTFEMNNITKLIGEDGAKFITSLCISGNRIGMCIGLECFSDLKKLDLSHNNLTTLSGLQILPKLEELKVGWNYLRFFQSNVTTLALATPNLLVLELLPNTFQDIKELAHIPIILKREIPSLRSVDHWKFPIKQTTKDIFPRPAVVNESRFPNMSRNIIWGTSTYAYDLSNSCFTDLNKLPISPPFPEDSETRGIDFNISVNYLNESSLINSNFIYSRRWRASIVKLQLQENLISNLDWLKGHIFYNVQVLNLSNNNFTGLDLISKLFPSLKHLHISGNPLVADVSTLSPIENIRGLISLDCSNTPLSFHPDYSGHISKFFPFLEILDGMPISRWQLAESVKRLNGTFTPDWLKANKSGDVNYDALTSLSFASSNLMSISLPASAVSKLMTLDLCYNELTTLSSLASLPSLRVLCVSHNRVSGLGDHACSVCPTAESIAWNIRKGKRTNTSGIDRHEAFPELQRRKSYKIPKKLKSPPISKLAILDNKKDIFPRLRVIIMAHNGLSTASDLHLHGMPYLQTVILNCNKLVNLKGIENLHSMTVLVLDNNMIGDVPYNSFNGCDNLRYLHLEHNRIAALPRLPHLTNLTALYLSNNQVQDLTDLSLTGSKIRAMTLRGNPVADQYEYRTNTAIKLPQLSLLDGTFLSTDIESNKKMDRQLHSTEVVQSADPIRPQISAGPTRPKTRAGPSRPQTDVGPSRPQASAGPSRPKTNTGKSRPQTSPGPSCTKTNAGPSCTKTNAGPSCTKANTGPLRTKTNAGPSRTKTIAGPSHTKTNAGPSRTKTNADKSRPQTSVVPSRPKPNTDTSRPKTSVGPSRPQTSATPSLSLTSSDPSRPQINDGPSGRQANSDPPRPEATFGIEIVRPYVEHVTTLGLKVRPLTPHFATASPRSHQMAAFKPIKRIHF